MGRMTSDVFVFCVKPKAINDHHSHRTRVRLFIPAVLSFQNDSKGPDPANKLLLFVDICIHAKFLPSSEALSRHKGIWPCTLNRTKGWVDEEHCQPVLAMTCKRQFLLVLMWKTFFSDSFLHWEHPGAGTAVKLSAAQAADFMQAMGITGVSPETGRLKSHCTGSEDEVFTHCNKKQTKKSPTNKPKKNPKNHPINQTTYQPKNTNKKPKQTKKKPTKKPKTNKHKTKRTPKPQKPNQNINNNKTQKTPKKMQLLWEKGTIRSPFCLFFMLSETCTIFLPSFKPQV